MKKCVCNLFDKEGPMYHNEGLRNEILKNGFSFKDTFPNKRDIDYKDWGKDITVLHKETGKVSGYDCYVNFKEDKVVTIFNGFFQQPIKTPLKEFMWIYDANLIDYYSKVRVEKGLPPIHKFKRGQIFKGNPNFKKQGMCTPKGRYQYILNEKGDSFYQYEGACVDYEFKSLLDQNEIDEKYYILLENPTQKEINMFKNNLENYDRR